MLREHAGDCFVPPGTGPLAPLTDLAVHTRDVARPLGLRTTAALRGLARRARLPDLTPARRGFVPRGRTDGLRFRATDQDWVQGDGPEISGPSEALALAIGGRAVALDDLAGPGLPVLRGRLASRFRQPRRLPWLSGRFPASPGPSGGEFRPPWSS